MLAIQYWRDEQIKHDFEMKLIQPIDALNNAAFIEVLEICYPSTTTNVGEQDCWFILQIFYENFKETADGVTYDQNQLHFLSEQFNIPEGIYDLKKLIKFLNNVLGEYDIFISNDNGKIRISVNMYIEYWLNQKSSNTGKSHDGSDLNKFHLPSSSCNNLKKNF